MTPRLEAGQNRPMRRQCQRNRRERVFKPDSLTGKGVDSGSLDLRRTVTPESIWSQRINGYQDDVEARARWGDTSGGNEQKRKESRAHSVRTSGHFAVLSAAPRTEHQQPTRSQKRIKRRAPSRFSRGLAQKQLDVLAAECTDSTLVYA